MADAMTDMWKTAIEKVCSKENPDEGFDCWACNSCGAQSLKSADDVKHFPGCRPAQIEHYETEEEYEANRKMEEADGNSTS